MAKEFGMGFPLCRDGESIWSYRRRRANELELYVSQKKDECHELFVTKAMVQGSLISSSRTQRLIFHTSPAFVATLGQDNIVHEIGMSRTLVNNQIPPTGWPTLEPFDTVLKAVEGVSGRPQFKITMGRVAINVERVGHNKFEFLNIEVTGVAEIRLPIGGILGADGHENVTKVPVQCHKARARLHGTDLITPTDMANQYKITVS